MHLPEFVLHDIDRGALTQDPPKTHTRPTQVAPTAWGFRKQLCVCLLAFVLEDVGVIIVCETDVVHSQHLTNLPCVVCISVNWSIGRTRWAETFEYSIF